MITCVMFKLFSGVTYNRCLSLNIGNIFALISTSSAQPNSTRVLYSLPSLPERIARVVNLGLFLCVSVRTRNSKTISPIDLNFLYKK